MALQELSVREKAVLYSCAKRCFRDVADQDYICARINYRIGLLNQFQWCALQAIEKYFKAILLFNSKDTNGIGHNLKEALSRVRQITTFTIDLDDDVEAYILRLNNYGENRYLERETYSLGDDLMLLDRAVWTIRRYCQVLDSEIMNLCGEKVNLLEINLKEITSQWYLENPHKFRLFDGFLESVLAKPRRDELRKGLVWNNFKYGTQKKIVLKAFTFKSHSQIPPHYLHPENFDLLKRYIQFPKDVRNDFAS